MTYQPKEAKEPQEHWEKNKARLELQTKKEQEFQLHSL
jgi:hypothetical protein